MQPGVINQFRNSLALRLEVNVAQDAILRYMPTILGYVKMRMGRAPVPSSGHGISSDAMIISPTR